MAASDRLPASFGDWDDPASELDGSSPASCLPAWEPASVTSWGDGLGLLEVPQAMPPSSKALQIDKCLDKGISTRRSRFAQSPFALQPGQAATTEHVPSSFAVEWALRLG